MWRFATNFVDAWVVDTFEALMLQQQNATTQCSYNPTNWKCCTYLNISSNGVVAEAVSRMSLKRELEGSGHGGVTLRLLRNIGTPSTLKDSKTPCNVQQHGEITQSKQAFLDIHCSKRFSERVCLFVGKLPLISATMCWCSCRTSAIHIYEPWSHKKCGGPWLQQCCTSRLSMLEVISGTSPL